MPISFFSLGEETYFKTRRVGQTLAVQDERETRVGQSLKVEGPPVKLTVYNSFAVSELGEQTYLVPQSMKVVNRDTDPVFASMVINGLKNARLSQSLGVKDFMTYKASQGLIVGNGVERAVGQSMDVMEGDSFLILADIVSEEVGSATAAANEAQDSTQIIDLGGATSGTWSLWLTYGAYVLNTVELELDATAQEVQDALLALENVPTPESILVSGADGGPYFVEFVDAMGGRFIAPLILEITNLVGADEDTGIAISTSGTSAGSFPDQELDAELKVNGEVVDIIDFDYQEPEGKLGALLNIKLLKPDIAQVPMNASVEFSILVKTASGYVPRVLMQNGKLSGRNYKITYTKDGMGGPRDEVSFSAIDVVADKFSMAPRRPVTVFDPNKVQFSDVEIKPRDAIIDQDGNPILPIYEPIPGLNSGIVIQRAYTNAGASLIGVLSPSQRAAMRRMESYFGRSGVSPNGLGFNRVVCNIPPYDVMRADFTLTEGWHGGAQTVVGMYDPLYLPVANDLYVLNTEYALPYGSVPRVIPLDLPSSINLTHPYKPDTNAILVTYQIPASEDTSDTWFVVHEFDPPEVTPGGTEDEPGYSETTTRKGWIRKKRYDTLEVVDEVLEFVNTEVRQDFDGSGFLNLVKRERQQIFYYDDVKVGHFTRVEGLLLSGPSRSASMRTILEETNNTQWVEDPTTPGQKIQARNWTRVEELCYETVEEIPYINPRTGAEETILKSYPASLANASNIEIADTATLVMKQTKIIEETLRHIGANQYDVQVTETDCLTGTIVHSKTTPRTGNTSTNPYEMRSKTMLRRDLDSEEDIGPRIPISLNTAELPRERAIQLADLVLYRAKNPLGTMNLPFTRVEFGVAKGTVFIGQTRTDYTKRSIVTALSINGRNIRQNGHRITMTVDALELPPTPVSP